MIWYYLLTLRKKKNVLVDYPTKPLYSANSDFTCVIFEQFLLQNALHTKIFITFSWLLFSKGYLTR